MNHGENKISWNIHYITTILVLVFPTQRKKKFVYQYICSSGGRTQYCSQRTTQYYCNTTYTVYIFLIILFYSSSSSSVSLVVPVATSCNNKKIYNLWFWYNVFVIIKFSQVGKVPRSVLTDDPSMILYAPRFRSFGLVKII